MHWVKWERFRQPHAHHILNQDLPNNIVVPIKRRHPLVINLELFEVSRDSLGLLQAIITPDLLE